MIDDLTIIGGGLTLLCLAWFAAEYLPKWNARLKLRRAARNAAAYQRHLDGQVADEERRWAEWRRQQGGAA